MNQNAQGKKAWMVSLVSTIFMLGIFAVAALFLVNVGVQVYKNIVVANNDNFELRTSLSYIAAKVRQADATGQIGIREVDGVRVLVLGEENEDGAFETCLYFWDGYLYEHFMEKDGYFEPGYGMETFEAAELWMEETEEGQLYFRVKSRAGDMQELYLTLRAARQGA